MKKIIFSAAMLAAVLGTFAQQKPAEKKNVKPTTETQAPKAVEKTAAPADKKSSPAPKKHYPKKKVQELKKLSDDKTPM